MMLNGDENDATPTPSSSEFRQQEKALHSAVEEVKVGGPMKCCMQNGWCVTHNSEVMRVKTKVKKWTYIDRKKQYGYKYSTAVRLICKSGGDQVPDLERAQSDQTRGISDVERQERESQNKFSLEGEMNQGLVDAI